MPPKSSVHSASPVNVVLPVGGEVIVDDAGDLLDVDAPGEQVGGDEHTGGPGAELTHDHVALLLVHVAVLKKKEEAQSVNRVSNVKGNGQKLN